MDVLKHFFDLGYLYQHSGLDTVIYALMAMVGSALFVVRLSLTLLLGVDGDLDLDGDSLEHGTGFAFFSVLSVISFFMGAGWAGLAARIEWQLGGVGTAAVAGGFGTLLMMLSSLLMLGAARLTHEVTYQLKDAVGRTATVYMTIPAKGEGAGQVRVSVSGRSMVVDAVSAGPKIDAFVAAEVTDLRDDKTLVVTPCDPS